MTFFFVSCIHGKLKGSPVCHGIVAHTGNSLNSNEDVMLILLDGANCNEFEAIFRHNRT